MFTALSKSTVPETDKSQCIKQNGLYLPDNLSHSDKNAKDLGDQ